MSANSMHIIDIFNPNLKFGNFITGVTNLTLAQPSKNDSDKDLPNTARSEDSEMAELSAAFKAIKEAMITGSTPLDTPGTSALPMPPPPSFVEECIQFCVKHERKIKALLLILLAIGCFIGAGYTHNPGPALLTLGGIGLLGGAFFTTDLLQKIADLIKKHKAQLN